MLKPCRKLQPIAVFLMASLLCGLFCASCRGREPEKLAPKAVNGVLDLRQWDFETDGPAALDGEWAFYWEQFLSNRDFHSHTPREKTGIITAPGVWNGYMVNTAPLKGNGYATYRLEVLLNPAHERCGMKIRSMATAYELEINGVLAAQNGVIGRTKAAGIPEYRTKRIYLSKRIVPAESSGSLSIILRISNFHYRKGGPWNSIILGPQLQITKREKKDERIEWFLIGSLLMMAFYHFWLFALKRKEYSTLVFGLFSAMSALRTLTVGELFLFSHLPTAWWIFCVKVEYLSLYISNYLIMLFLHILFPMQFKRIALKIITCFYIALILIVLLTPPHVFSHTAPPYQVFGIGLLLYMTHIVIRACIDREEGAGIFLGSVLIMAAVSINDILHTNNFINTGEYYHFGIIVLAFSQSVILSRRFSNAYARIEELSGTLTDQNQQLRRMDELKDEFLANTSHELRTPLNGIVGLAESLIDGATGRLSLTTIQNLNMIVQSGKRLTNLVNDILDFAKLRKRDLQIQCKPVDFYSAVDLVLAFSKHLLVRKPVKLINETPKNLPPLYADENRLHQILYNLIGNAVKFTHKGEVRVSAVKEKSRIRIMVKDTGIGIPPGKQDQIFQSFVQVDGSIAREYGGTGLGLAITKKLVELHNGQIWVESTPHVGTTFSFTVPIADSHVETDADTSPAALPQESDDDTDTSIISEAKDYDIKPAPASESAIQDLDFHARTDNEFSAKRTILVVDDEPVNIQVLQNQLQLQNYRVLTAGDGMQALDLMQHENPDLILLDLMMPRMNGFEVSQTIRKSYSPSELPIIMLTAKDQTDDMVVGFESGASDYITKPFNKNELLERINVHLGLKTAITEIKTMLKTFEKFVPAKFLNRIAKEGITHIKIGNAESDVITILFTDIRSFTHLSESMSPQDLLDFLNSFFKCMNAAIHRHNGFIDKFIGDAIMAIFDNPDASNASEAHDAVLAAISMQEALRGFNRDRRETAASCHDIEIGIGIHSGPVIIGTVGSDDRMDSTVIGDAVNIASRLEGLTKYYKTKIIVSSEIYHLLEKDTSLLWRKLDDVYAKGKDRPIGIYEVFNSDEEDIKNTKLRISDRYHEGIRQYLGQNWDAAIALFQECLRIYPEDSVSAIYLDRCRQYRKYPPEKDWNGVWRMVRK